MPKSKPSFSRRRRKTVGSRIVRNLCNNKRLSVAADNSNNDLPELEIEIDTTPELNLFDLVKGRRIVNVAHILKCYEEVAIHPYVCTMGKMKPMHKTRQGLQCMITFFCDNCDKSIVISSDPVKGRQKEVNEALVWGSLSVGLGRSQCEELLGVIDVPCLTQKSFLKHTRNIKKNWQNYLLAEMRSAGEEERRIAIEKGNITEEGIPYITVIGDGGWSKRTYGHGYNALSGVGIIIGAETKKPLFMGVRNKMCSVCHYYTQKQLSPKKHECSMNFKGPSTAMEHDIIIEGFNASIEQHNLIYKYYIGDGDSNVYSKIIERVSYGRKVMKIECANHMTRNISQKLHKLVANTQYPLQHRQYLTNKQNGISRLERLVKGIRTAIKRHKNHPDKLRAELYNAPYHILGQHDNCCPSFCTRKDVIEDNYVSIMEENGIFLEIKKIINPMIIKSDRLAFNQTTNQAERFMSLVSKFVGGKRINFSKSISYAARTNGAALSHFLGPSWHIQSWKYSHNNCLGEISSRVFLKKQQSHLPRKEMSNYTYVRRRKIINGPDENYGATSAQEDMPLDRLKNGMEIVLQKQRQIIDTDEKWNNLEIATRGQHMNQTWREMRKNILTASNFGAVVRRRIRTPCHNLIKRLLYGHDIHTKSILYGRNNEDRAIKKYEESTSTAVRKCGLFICREYPFLGASPDGLVEEDGLIEIKCLPSVGSEKLLNVQNKNVCFQIINNSIRLKRSHPYHYQIQGQMNICRKKFCDFIIYTENDFHVERIYVDSDLWTDKMVPKLKNFYLKCMLPEIVDGRIPRGLKARDGI